MSRTSASSITEKILAAHCGRDRVEPGEILNAKVDIALGNDVTAPIAIKAFREAGARALFDRERVVLVPDHFAPNRDIESAEQCRILRDFAREHDVENYFEQGEGGIEHALLPELGLVHPGEVVIGADSHTCSYGALGAFATGVGSTDLAAAMMTGELWLRVPESMKFIYEGELPLWVEGKDLILHTIGDIGVDGALYRAMEFTGPVVKRLGMAGRFTMANMAIEAGAKNGIFEPDETTRSYMEGRAKRPWKEYASDPDARYVELRRYDCSKLEPLVAAPHLPSNVRPARAFAGVAIDQVFIGSCTNGRIEDLQVAAAVLRGRKVKRGIKLIIIPATAGIWREALSEGLLEIFSRAGATIGPPTCGPCLGGHMGVLADGERCVATTNRNFQGRMGHAGSEIYLANPAVAAASSVTGRITHPADL